MRFIDLPAQQKRIREKIESRLRAVLDHGQYISGPEIEILESELAAYTGTRHALACSSGTDALLLALMAYGVGAGDAVITTPFTFVATAGPISLLGAVPVFADIDSSTFNIDPAKLEAIAESFCLEKAANCLVPEKIRERGLKLRGIIAVDLFGTTADYARIGRVAKKHGLFVIEDAAQSFGAECLGKKAGALADMGCTSFFPAKPLGTYGDGGMCFTDDDLLAEKIRSFRVHGQGSNMYESIRVGINGRLDTMQAAVLLAKMEIFPEELELRQERATIYRTLLDGSDSPVICPGVPDGYTSAWAQYSVLTKEGISRSTLQEKLKAAGVPTAVYYPRPLHLQQAFAGLGYARGDFPVSEDCAARIFSLPMHPYLAKEDQEKIARIIKGC
jgi:UDP-2-acetamido-2-deoxy-ribo-hexuluronate aminotransferase